MLRTLEHVREGEAPAPLAGTFRDVRRALRTPWVPLLFRALAVHGNLLRPVWKQLRPDLLTRAFEEASDDLRAHMAKWAEDLGTPLIEPVLMAEGFDVDALDEVREAVNVFHYSDPKILLCTTVLSELAAGRRVGGARVHPALLETFEPEDVLDQPHLEPLSEEPGGLTGEIFAGILETTHLPVATADLCVLGRWPSFLDVAWNELQPVFQHPQLEHALTDIRRMAMRFVQRQLPFPVLDGLDAECRRTLVQLAPVLQQLLDGTPRLALFATALKVSLDGVDDALGSPYPLDWQGVEDEDPAGISP